MPEFARRVLIIQDDSAVVDTLACALTLQGYLVLRARTLADARAGMIRQPDVLLADLTLPDGSGLELIRRLRRRNDPVVIAVVVEPGDAEAARALEPLHPDVIFPKPMDVQAILAWLFNSTRSGF